MAAPHESHRERILGLLAVRGMARLAELKEAGVTASSVSRLEREGSIVRLARGLYQLADANLDSHHALAEAAKLVPRGVICLASALAFHELTDRQPRRVWIALGPKEWRPRLSRPVLRYVHYARDRLWQNIETHRIEGVDVPITNPVRTVVDLFKYRRTAGEDLALEGLREALRTGKATPAALARAAQEARQWRIIRPYLEALTSHA